LEYQRINERTNLWYDRMVGQLHGVRMRELLVAATLASAKGWVILVGFTIFSLLMLFYGALILWSPERYFRFQYWLARVKRELERSQRQGSTLGLNTRLVGLVAVLFGLAMLTIAGRAFLSLLTRTSVAVGSAQQSTRALSHWSDVVMGLWELIVGLYLLIKPRRPLQWHLDRSPLRTSSQSLEHGIMVMRAAGIFLIGLGIYELVIQALKVVR
jgi:hypothetical protein